MHYNKCVSKMVGFMNSINLAFFKCSVFTIAKLNRNFSLILYKKL